MTVWKMAKDFRHIERMINHFDQDIKRGLELKGQTLMGEVTHLTGVAEAVDFRGLDLSKSIGQYVQARAQQNIASGAHEPLSDARIEVRDNGGIGYKPEPNVRGSTFPLISSDTL